MTSAEQLAKQFHEIYERLAPGYGYETRPDTKVFNPKSNNGRLMIAVCNEILTTQQENQEDRYTPGLKVEEIISYLHNIINSGLSITSLKRISETALQEVYYKKYIKILKRLRTG